MKAKSKTAKPKETIGHRHAQICVADVDNPSYMRDHPADRTNPLKVKAFVNVRESPIGLLAVRKLIGEHQIRAAAKFRELWENMGGASVKAMDYSKDPVDGGGIADPISIRQMDAARELRDLRAYVGVRPYGILVKVIGEGIEIAALGANKRECLMVSNYLKDGLADAAQFWGYQTSDKGRERVA